MKTMMANKQYRNLPWSGYGYLCLPLSINTFRPEEQFIDSHVNAGGEGS